MDLSFYKIMDNRAIYPQLKGSRYRQDLKRIPTYGSKWEPSLSEKQVTPVGESKSTQMYMEMTRIF